MPSEENKDMADGQINVGGEPVFKGIDPIKFEGPDSDNPLAYRYYNNKKILPENRVKKTAN